MKSTLKLLTPVFALLTAAVFAVQTARADSRVVYSPSYSGTEMGTSAGSEIKLDNGYTGFLVPPRRNTQRDSLIVMLHEHGGRANLFAPVGRKLRAADTWVLSIQANHAAWDMNKEKEMAGNSWWKWRPDDTPREQYSSLEDEVGKLNEAITTFVSERSIDPARVSLVGFAQGARVSQELAGRNPEDYRAVVLLGGYSGMLEDWKPEMDSAGSVPNYYISIADGDDLTPLKRAFRLEEDLKSRGAEVYLSYVNKTHNIISPEISEIRDWLHDQIGRKRESSGLS